MRIPVASLAQIRHESLARCMHAVQRAQNDANDTCEQRPNSDGLPDWGRR